MLKTDPKKVRGQHYDIVVNGVELGGGSIRIHQPDVQKTVFEEVLQIPPDMVKARFGYMLEAFRFGAPPHGGIALGFDRLIAILCNTPSIRDVIAFPKTAKGTCSMTDSPGSVEPKQLRDRHLESKWRSRNLIIRNKPPMGTTLRRRAIRMLLALGIAYSLLVLAAAVFQRRLIYFPRTIPPALAEPAAAELGFVPWRNLSGQIIGWKLPAASARRECFDNPWQCRLRHGPRLSRRPHP